MDQLKSPEPSTGAPIFQQRLLAIIAVILVFWALKAAAPVALPLACALFLVAVFWPLQKRFEKFMPKAVAAVLCLLIFLGAVAAFCSALWFSSETVADQWPKYSQKFETYWREGAAFAENFGLAVPEPDEAWQAERESSKGLSSSALFSGIKRTVSVAGAFVLILAFLALALLEVRDYKGRLSQILPAGKSAAWKESFDRISSDFQRYIAVRTVVGLITGSAVWLFSWLIGLDFAIVWGLTNFLLNYIPTIGSIVAVIPPTLFALVQFENPSMALLVLAVVGGVQILMGAYIDPLMQGKYLALSPLVVLLSVTFWGWLWGVGGAFISVPLTVFTVIACNQFDRTRWIATMLAEYKEKG